ncbi:mannosyltransferase [Lecanora helva]
MPLRPTRSIAILLAVLGLFTTISYLEGKLKSYSRGRISIITAPVQHATPPDPHIVDFWAEIAPIFQKARPQIPPIELKQNLDGVDLQGGDAAKDNRKPFEKSIGLPQDAVHELTHKHLQLITHTKVDEANDRASDIFKGTGIVTVAGGPYFPPAILSIRMLRRTNSTLPVQVFLQSQSEYERAICEDVLPALNAECFVIEDFLRKGDLFDVTPYQLKVLAMLFSSFQKVLYLDSDCFPLLDPTGLFTSEPFKSTGFLSWPDYWIATEDPIFYKIAGLPDFPKGVPARSSETGQLMVDKTKHLSSLLLATYYNIFGPEIYHPILSQGSLGGGDKETFLAAAVVLKKPFYRTKEPVGTVGYIDPSAEFHGGAMIQYSPADEWSLAHGGNITTELEQNPLILTNHNAKKPRPFFLHANVPKMNVARLLDDKSIFLPNTEQRIRLWGDKNSNTAMFGYDVEKVVWDEMRHMACDVEARPEDLRGKWRLCDRANQHYKELFDPKAVNVPEKKRGGRWI